MGVGRWRQGVIPVRQTAHYTSVTQWRHWEHQRQGRRQGAKGRTQTGDGHWHTWSEPKEFWSHWVPPWVLNRSKQIQKAFIPGVGIGLWVGEVGRPRWLALTEDTVSWSMPTGLKLMSFILEKHQSGPKNKSWNNVTVLWFQSNLMKNYIITWSPRGESAHANTQVIHPSSKVSLPEFNNKHPSVLKGSHLSPCELNTWYEN